MVALALAAFCLTGLAAGFLLLRRIPAIPECSPCGEATLAVSVIIPARDEAANLPALLGSLMQSNPRPAEVIVVDDGSTDGTAEVASRYGATVVASTAAPDGWRGKNWACQQGADVAVWPTLFFLDADTYFAPGGFERIVAYFRGLPANAAVSILPFHAMEMPYEELSLFFNLLMAIGTGGFSGLDKPRLFGQSLLIERELYLRAGGHAAVRQHLLENLAFAPRLRAANGVPYTACGRGTLLIRMFPDGLGQLRASWEKAFAFGAGSTSSIVLLLSIYWLSAAATVFWPAVFGVGMARPAALALYLLFALQIAWLSRQIGAYNLLTALFYPLPLLFYFVVFFRSAWLQRMQRPVAWKGRQL